MNFFLIKVQINKIFLELLEKEMRFFIAYSFLGELKPSCNFLSFDNLLGAGLYKRSPVVHIVSLYIYTTDNCLGERQQPINQCHFKTCSNIVDNIGLP